jgi:hypothetical protein
MMNKHTSIGTSIARLAWPVVAPDLREWAESVEHMLGGVVFAIEPTKGWAFATKHLMGWNIKSK